MKKTITVLFAALLMACGEKGADGAKTEVGTKDVKGTIDLMGGKLTKGSLITNDGTFEQAIVEFENSELTISPTSKTFDDTYGEAKSMAESFSTTIEELDKKDNYVMYKENSDFAGEKREGYIVLMVKKGKDKSYVLKGKGDMLKPIPTKEEAEKILKAAQSFEPAQ